MGHGDAPRRGRLRAPPLRGPRGFPEHADGHRPVCCPA
ncbi:hypothetical protein C884_02089 [Kocuria palustris PEL]|uniref:Uncharacterized protein n=1 Tax=Kocuria palustris PEL TaxID=1236550 RepID=M2YF49_9MICC|nr:hypothetical protein C884_02089 [Kocuria palustris PEL]